MSTRGTIMVVDDDDDTRNCVSAVLEGEGYTVVSARNGRDALELLARSSPPDLVLLDLMMPIMSGWDVMDALAATPEFSTLPVVLFTAAGDPIAREQTLKKPVLRKPIDLDLLLAMVGKFCEAGWAVREPPSDLLPKLTD